MKMRISKKLGLFAGALVVAGFSGASMAEVQYYTVGTFGATDAGWTPTNGVAPAPTGPDGFGLFHGANQAASLVYNFDSTHYVELDYSNLSQGEGVHHLAIDAGETASDDLGTFTVTSNVTSTQSTPLMANGHETFDLEVWQLDPSSGSQKLVGNLQGSIKAVPPNQAVNSQNPVPLAITFSPTFWTLGENPEVLWSLGDANNKYPNGEFDLVSQTTTLEATITVAPLPATASMGLGLFGVIGAAGVLNGLRRRRAVAL